MVAQLTSPMSQRDWQPIIRALEKAVGKDSVVRRKEELLVYECDGLASYRQRPPVVVLPRTTEQVAAAIRVCHRFGVPFVPRGAGTGLSGGGVAGGRRGVDCHGDYAPNFARRF